MARRSKRLSRREIKRAVFEQKEHERTVKALAGVEPKMQMWGIDYGGKDQTVFELYKTQDFHEYKMYHASNVHTANAVEEISNKIREYSIRDIEMTNSIGLGKL